MKDEGGTPCARCGAVVPGGTAGCFALFGQVVALEYGDPAYGAVNLLAVETLMRFNILKTMASRTTLST